LASRSGRGGCLNEQRRVDAERDATVDRLREAAAEGRLTLEELTDRIEAAARAVMRSDLVPLASDLPATGVGEARAGRRAHRVAPGATSAARRASYTASREEVGERVRQKSSIA
jgi:hypothetical protein